MKKIGFWFGLFLVLLVIAGSSFWLGMWYEQQKFFAQRLGFSGGPMGMFQGSQPSGNSSEGIPARTGEMIVSGKVDKVEEGAITITTRFGSQKIKFSSAVKVEKPQEVDLGEIKKGTEVLVRGERKDDKFFEAKEILINFSLAR